MIKLYREEHSPMADTIEAEFREMVLGYDRMVVEADEAAQLFGAEMPLPVITNNERSSAVRTSLRTSKNWEN